MGWQIVQGGHLTLKGNWDRVQLPPATLFRDKSAAVWMGPCRFWKFLVFPPIDTKPSWTLSVRGPSGREELFT